MLGSIIIVSDRAFESFPAAERKIGVADARTDNLTARLARKLARLVGERFHLEIAHLLARIDGDIDINTVA